MSKIKVKKQSTFIDMTAMSDVTVLLLTFFMLTSNFLSKEPITVTTPSSVSEISIPETNKLQMLIDSNGTVYMSLDNVNDRAYALVHVGQDYGIEFTQNEVDKFTKLQTFGIPIADMKAFLNLSVDEQDKYVKANMGTDKVGIPTKGKESLDSEGKTIVDNEFKRWVQHAHASNENLQLAIKADQNTKYPVVSEVMDNLRAMRKNRYLMITSLKTASND